MKALVKRSSSLIFENYRSSFVKFTKMFNIKPQEREEVLFSLKIILIEEKYAINES